MTNDNVGQPEQRLPSLMVPRDEAKQLIMTQIEEGQALLDTPIQDAVQLLTVKDMHKIWRDDTVDLLRQLFDTDELADQFSGFGSYSERLRTFREQIDGLKRDLHRDLVQLGSIYNRLERFPVAVPQPLTPTGGEDFIKVTSIPDDFYQRLINEINQLYSEGLPFSLSILIRKLLENLIIDILRERYGRQQVPLYYDTSRRRFHDFSVLLQNLDSHKADFHYIAPDLDTPIIQSINQYRETGNSAAHSIDANLTIERVSQGKDDINHLVQYLLRIFQRL
jgi:hypothetical protein